MEIAKTESLSDLAYRYILEKIMTFDFKPNDAIIENDICSELNISRTPLREALRRLEAEGYVTKSRNRGTFVRPYTENDISEIYDIRCVFELYALKNCIAAVDDAEIRRLREEVLALKDPSDSQAFFKTDNDLHHMILRHCMNERMVRVLHSLTAQLGIVQVISAQGPNRFQPVNEEHLAILDAIEKRDLERASALLAQHIENVKQACIQAFKQMRMDA